LYPSSSCSSAEYCRNERTPNVTAGVAVGGVDAGFSGDWANAGADRVHNNVVITNSRFTLVSS
jgi:hypothetical protein